MLRLPLASAAVLLAASLTACTASTNSSGAGPSSEPTPTQTTATPPSESPTSETSSPTDSPTQDGPVTPGEDLLDWQPVPGPVGTVVTAGGQGWTVSVAKGGRSARIEGPAPRTVRAGPGRQITDVLLDGRRVVVVAQDTQARREDRTTIVDLASGGTAVLDGASDPPTTTGGTWALGQELVVHAGVGPGGAYCLATVSLESGQGSLGWCAPERHGFRGAVITPAGLSVMSFDDARPVSCATLLAVDGDQATPFDGVTECQGWDAARLDGGGAVWSEVPQPHRQDHAELHASVGGQSLDLGPGTTGSLVWCGTAAYFVRDPQTNDDPARLMRFTPDGALSVVYESPSRGNAFLSAPRCGGDTLTLTSFGAAGDEQVSATVS